MEDRRPLSHRQTRKVEFLKCRGRRGWDSDPVRHRVWPHLPRLAKPAIRGVVLELEGEQVEGELIEAG